jgi:transposase-like protein
MVRIECPKCRSKKVYRLGSGKRRCARCRYEFVPHRLPLYLSRDQWKEIIRWFLLEQSSENISLRTSIERKRVLRALTRVRRALTKDVPDVFTGTVEVDETYLGGQWKNKRKPIRDHGTKRGRGTKRQSVFGILCRNGTVWAEVVNDVEADTLQPLISRHVSPGSIVCSDTWKAYTGIASRGFVHRLVNHGERQYSDGKRESLQRAGGVLGVPETETGLERRDPTGKITTVPRRIHLAL